MRPRDQQRAARYFKRVLIDGLELQPGERIETDVAIIGSGPAGMTLAILLAEAGRDVTVIESGGLEREDPISALNEGTSSGINYPLGPTRVRKLGGTSDHWTGICRPLDPWDFTVRDWVPGSGWPITWDDLAPHFDAAGKWLELQPGRYDWNSWTGELGPDDLALDPELLVPEIVQVSAPTRFGDVYRARLVDHQRATVIIHSTVTEIVASEQATAVAHLAVSTLAGNSFEVSANRYVLAAGGIENARILLASRSVSPKGLGNDNDLVGRYFMEHPHIYQSGTALLARTQEQLAPFFGVVPSPPGAVGPSGKPQPTMVAAALALPDSLQTKLQCLGGTFSISRPAGGAERTQPERWPTFRTGGLTAGALAQFVDSDSHVYQLVIRTEQAPNRDNRVTLNDDKDALGVPIADLHWTVGELENATFDALFASLAMATGQADLGRTNEDVDERNKVTGGPHHMGTTRMAADPKDGVVDADCKVFGIDNLWVAGSSVFPTSGWANPTLTLVALADRLAGHLLSR